MNTRGILGVFALAAATCTCFGQTSGPSPWSLNFAYDVKINRPLALANFSVLSSHSPQILPQFTLSTVAFGGSILGGNSSAVTGGIGEQLSYVSHGITFSAFFGQAFTIGATPDTVFGVGITVPVK